MTDGKRRERPRSRSPLDLVRIRGKLRRCEVTILANARRDLRGRVDAYRMALSVFDRCCREGRSLDFDREMRRRITALQARLRSYTRTRGGERP
jgi:hypothetical protein